MGWVSRRRAAVLDTRPMIRALLLALVLLAPLGVRAETTPAIPSPCGQGDVFKSGGAQSCTASGLCQALVSPSGFMSITDTTIQCMDYNTYQAQTFPVVRVPPGASCPDSTWTLVGDMCSRDDCAAGQVRNSSGVCQTDCASKAGRSKDMWCMVGAATATSCGGADSGCQVRCKSVTFNSGASGAASVNLYPRQAYGSDCRYTGQQPTQAEVDSGAMPVTDEEKNEISEKKAAEPTPSKCAMMGSDYVQLSSGVKTCAGGDDNVTKAAEKETSKSPSTPNASTLDPATSDSNKKATSCTGNDCTTKETDRTPPDTAKNGPANGGCANGATLVDGKCQTDTVKTQTKGDYCTQNPKDKVCTGVTGETQCDKYPKSLGCASLGTAEEIEPEAPKAFGLDTIVAVVLPKNASCPASVALPYGAEFSYEKICEAMDMLRPILIALAWISAAFIVFGHKKD